MATLLNSGMCSIKIASNGINFASLEAATGTVEDKTD